MQTNQSKTNEKNNLKKSMQKEEKVAESKPIKMTFGIRQLNVDARVTFKLSIPIICVFLKKNVLIIMLIHII